MSTRSNHQGAAIRQWLMFAVAVLRCGQPFRADWADQASAVLAEKAKGKEHVPDECYHVVV